MALTPARWILMALLGAALLATWLVSPDTPVRVTSAESAEVLHFRRVQRRTFEAAHKLRSRTRADSVIATLPIAGQQNARIPHVVMDALLPPAHRLLVTRTVERQWRTLHIDSALVPVTVAVVLDTASVPSGAAPSRRGELAVEYAVASPDHPAGTRQCVVIVSIQAPQLARPGAHGRLATRFMPLRNGEALLGPCAFQARFGIAGPRIDAWLRARSYDLALSPAWEPPDREEALRTPGTKAHRTTGQLGGIAARHLSPDAQGCATGRLSRCEAALAPPASARPLGPASLVTRLVPWEQHWGGLTRRYLSDLVTTLGPDRFGRFWRSDLPPDEALRVTAGMPLNAWTQRWAASLLGQVRTGPAPGSRDVLGAAMLALASLAVTAWGSARRQVR